jgi:hypothetical protein
MTPKVWSDELFESGSNQELLSVRLNHFRAHSAPGSKADDLKYSESGSGRLTGGLELDSSAELSRTSELSRHSDASLTVKKDRFANCIKACNSVAVAGNVGVGVVPGVYDFIQTTEASKTNRLLEFT